MNAKLTLALAGLALAAGLALTTLRHRPHPTQLTRTPDAVALPELNSTPAPAASTATTLSPPESSLPTPSLKEGKPPVLQTPPATRAQSSPQARPPAAAKKGKDPIQDPFARVALAWVGCDEVAEAYWVEAINDPSLSAQERQDLIDDLNEDGISDPKHPTPEDLPVILTRLAIIESLAPSAMDQVNAEAFMEAYKDLVNLARVSLGGGEPVR